MTRRSSTRSSATEIPWGWAEFAQELAELGVRSVAVGDQCGLVPFGDDEPATLFHTVGGRC
jgi:hypothetical protein